MTIFHTSLSDEQINLIEVNPELKKFVAEINHRMGLQVFAVKVSKELQNRLKEVEKGTSEYFNLLKHTCATMRALLGYPSGVFVCVVGCGPDENRKGDQIMSYSLASEFVVKDRGRGSDRMTRTSAKMVSLVKLLQSQMPKDDKEVFKRTTVKGVPSIIQHSVHHSMDIPWRDVDLSTEAQIALLKLFFENTTISNGDPVMAQMNKGWEHYKKLESRKAARDEYVLQFKNDIYVLVQTEKMLGFSFAKLKYDPTTNEYESGDIEYFTSIDDMMEKSPDFVIKYKMWKTATENSWNKDKQSDVIPCEEKFYKDFDVVVFNNSRTSVSAFGGYADQRCFITPV
jgi:hypothetical protein